MSLRRQLPAYTPVSWTALLTGVLTRPGDRRPLELLAGALRDELGARSVILTDSGTSALALAFRALAPAGRAPRVALPAYGCFDLVTAADGARAKVAFYDLDPATLSPDVDSLRAALGVGVDAVVVAHWYGIPADLESASREAATAGAVLIEDAAQGVGAFWRDRPAGATGALSVLSFGRGKGRGGAGGGALLLQPGAPAIRDLEPVDPPLRPARGSIRSLTALGGQLVLGRPSLYGIPSAIPQLGLGETRFRPPHEPAAMSASSAAVVASVRSLVEGDSRIRETWARAWSGRLAESAAVRSIAVSPEGRAGWLRYPMLARAIRHLDIEALARRGVLRGYPQTLDSLPGAVDRRLVESRFSGAETVVQGLITLPTHRFQTQEDVEVSARLLG